MSVITSVKDGVAATVGFLNEHRTAVIGVTAVMGALVAVTAAHSAVLAVAAAGGMLKYLQGLKLVSAATKAYAAVQWILNAAMTANPIGLIIVGLVALVAAVVIAYKKSDTFRAIVDKAFAVVKRAAKAVADFFTTKVPAAFDRVKSAASAVLGWVKGNWPKILAVLTGPFGIATLLIVKNWDKIKAGGVKVLDWIKGLPGKVKSAFSDAASWLLNAGRKIIDGLLAGLKEKWQAAEAWFKSITDKIPKLKGPPKKDGVLLYGAGRLIMEGFGRGLREGAVKPLEYLKTVAKQAVKNVKSQIDAFKSLRDAIKSAYSPDLFSSSPGMFGMDLKKQLAVNTSVIAAVKKLKGMNLNPAFLSGLIQSGNTGLITALAGSSASAVKSQQADWLAVQQTAGQLGTQTATAVVGKGLGELRTELQKLNKAVARLAKETGREVSKGVNKSASDGRRNGR